MKSTEIKLEEFLDENIQSINKRKNKKSQNIKNIKNIKNKKLEEILSINSDTEPNIELSIIKSNKKKSLRISIEIFVEGEILNFDLDIDKDTFFQLVKEME
jgi:hypothetical protein